MDISGQPDMFGDEAPVRTVVLPVHLNYDMRDARMHQVSGIEGLFYMPRFLDPACERQLIGHIDAEPWRHDLGRRVQHYGWIYDYRTRTITTDMRIGVLPDWIRSIAERLRGETGFFDRVPDQAIVNEYYPGQGIALHADRQCFGSTVATVSLGDDWEMKLRPVKGTSSQDRRIMLTRGSALIMTGDSRFRWMHGIDKRKTETDSMGQRNRERRLSLTFRTVLRRSISPADVF